MAERGIRVLQSYASANLGLIAYESEALEGMILDEALILRSCVRHGRARSGKASRRGGHHQLQSGLSPDTVRTGDLSAVLPGISPCGRTNTRIRGWMGRADQTTR